MNENLKEHEALSNHYLKTDQQAATNTNTFGEAAVWPAINANGKMPTRQIQKGTELQNFKNYQES